MNRGTWYRATVHRVAQSQTRLKRLNTAAFINLYISIHSKHIEYDVYKTHGKIAYIVFMSLEMWEKSGIKT